MQPYEKVPQSTTGGSEPHAAARRTRNAVRGWDNEGSEHQYLAPKEDGDLAAASMILSRMDEWSYERAAYDDADRIMQNHILPKSLPWHKPNVPLLRSLPRDIEDMQGVWHAGDDGEDSVFRNGMNSGPFGFGMFDMGGLRKDDVKGTRADTIIATKPSTRSTGTPQLGPEANANPSPTRRRFNKEEVSASDEDSESPIPGNDKFDAAARRSDDPGVIELVGENLNAMFSFFVLYLRQR